MAAFSKSKTYCGYLAGADKVLSGRMTKTGVFRETLAPDIKLACSRWRKSRSPATRLGINRTLSALLKRRAKLNATCAALRATLLNPSPPGSGSPLVNAFAQTLTTTVNQAANVLLSGTSSDNSALTFEVLSGPSHGTLSGTAPNLTYTPANGYQGTDSFAFRAGTHGTWSSSAVVSIYIGTWAPPLGIPAPAFGIEQTVANTYGSAGYYTNYVERDNPNCDDSGPGTPGSPRCSLPDNLVAGSVVIIKGSYDDGGAMDIEAHGTAQQPVFIRGASAADRGVVTMKWYIKGSYAIFENLLFDGETGGGEDDVGRFTVDGGDHIAIRHSELTGPERKGGLVLTGTDLVAYHNNLHDTGWYQANTDVDEGGGFVDGPSNRVWIVDNTCYRNGRACVSINPGFYNDGTVGNALIQNVYVGRNIAWENRETNFWSKHSTNAIFSENISSNPVDNRPNNSPCGMGFQYAPERTVFFANQIFNAANGICLQSNSVVNPGQNTYIIGNLIYGVSIRGILLRGGQNIHLMNNTIVDAGIVAPEAGASNAYYLANNIYSGVTTNNPGRIAQNSNNLICNSSSCGFVNAAVKDFRLASGSPAIDSGEVPSAYAAAQNITGLNMNFDLSGAVRPKDGNGDTVAAWDIGAFEK